MKVGVFGGTFDPIHNGHLIMASFIHDEMKLDKILFLPSENPPHKTNKKITDEKIRAEMVDTAIKNDSRFDLSLIEHGGSEPDYTYNTMSKLCAANPQNEYYFIIGGDSLRSIESWYRFEELMQLIQFIVIDRISRDEKPLVDLVEKFKTWSKGIHYLNMPLIELSSTLIRTRVKEHKSIAYMTPNEVIEIIEKNGLYDE
ncbi:nicotinate-nucleotide adenylyltransferase [Microaceticoccus formicicus]|uniref:nicotinate-nucleotide adenylyltransferase n=1 Tax=Microaceticoccus formicicus TaxID=3118105 RepID=UPI003CD02168|nr:nicotinate-nucleotide adenylyltransferase [Peptoniphilaceae bacterium AMB_02]